MYWNIYVFFEKARKEEMYFFELFYFTFIVSWMHSFTSLHSYRECILLFHSILMMNELFYCMHFLWCIRFFPSLLMNTFLYFTQILFFVTHCILKASFQNHSFISKCYCFTFLGNANGFFIENVFQEPFLFQSFVFLKVVCYV